MKLARHYIEWGKEVKEKYDEAFNYVRRVELRRPFPHSLEWYQTIVEVLKVTLLLLFLLFNYLFFEFDKSTNL